MSALPNLRGELRIREPMGRHVSWRAGGPADRYYRPADAADLAEFLRRLPPDEPILWLGLGSNLLVRDGGFRGTVIALHGVLDRIEPLASDAPGGRLRVEAGVHCARLAKHCAQQGLGGAAFFAGIPGTVGGALAMNAGAWGSETWQRVERVEVMNRRGELQALPVADFQVSYRTVRGPAPDLCFIAADMRFPPDPEARGREEIRDLLAQRREKQPVGQPSCGSVFRNPPGDHAARLIEAAGLKGRRVGDAVVSVKHANFILNSGEARADDIEDLVHQVRAEVRRLHGIELEPEVRIVGERGRV
jgi:UDP-N-acetylmuramate dehydrogenase